MIRSFFCCCSGYLSVAPFRSVAVVSILFLRGGGRERTTERVANVLDREALGSYSSLHTLILLLIHQFSKKLKLQVPHLDVNTSLER
jgi:hypothetical protein